MLGYRNGIYPLFVLIHLFNSWGVYMRYLSEKAIDYMDRVWGFRHSPHVDDMTMFWESDYPELTAKRLVEAGAVEPNCPEAKEMISVAKSITHKQERKIIDEVLKKYTVVSCDHCNHVHFIPQWCNPNDWINGNCDGCGRGGFM